jgi:hypothetical protein
VTYPEFFATACRVWCAAIIPAPVIAPMESASQSLISALRPDTKLWCHSSDSPYKLQNKILVMTSKAGDDSVYLKQRQARIAMIK